MKMGWFPYMEFENLAIDRGYLVLQYPMAIIAYTKYVLDLEDLFGTSAYCKLGMLTFIEKSNTK